MSNVELNERIKQQQKMFMQKVCEKHEYIKVTLTVTGINKPSHSYQCKNCGKTLNKYKKWNIKNTST